MNHPNPHPYIPAAVCAVCSGTGTTTRGVIFLRLRPCRTCHGSRFTTAAVAR